MRSGRGLFLPLFFAVLGIAFAAAVVWRVASYSPRNAAEPRPTPQETATAPTATDFVATSVDSGAATTTALAPSGRDIAAPESSGQAAAPAAVDAQPKPPANAQPQSLLSRLVTPIVNAFSGGASKSAEPQTAAASRPDQHGTTSQSQSQSHGSETGKGEQTSTAEKDLSSDTQPPQLLAIGFNPQQVQDGEATQLFVQAADDLAGIRTISGTVLGPSGAAQGFACQREGETDRYVARVAVPKDAADGMWRVNYLALSDFASNTATLAGAQLPQTASFRVVSSRPDAQGPTLKAVWLDRPAMRTGEKNTVFVDAEDDKSGLAMISGVFVSPSRHARVGFVCRAAEGPWPCEFAPPDCLDCGDWHLEQLQLQDKANNMTTVRSDNPLVAQLLLGISGDRCDSAPPSIDRLVLDRITVTNSEESSILVTAYASDDACGVMSISGQVTGPSTAGAAPRLYFSFSPAGDSQMWTGRIVVPRLAAKGTWRVTWVQALDRGHNLKTYSAGDPALATAMFNVQ